VKEVVEPEDSEIGVECEEVLRWGKCLSVGESW
jgi:hypothetical protein